jgi:tail protein X
MNGGCLMTAATIKKMPLPLPLTPLPLPPVPISPPTPVPPSQTITLAAGQRIYISEQDDWWDMIAIKVYGARRGNEHLMYRLLEANYALRNIAHFPAGAAVIVPAVQVETEIPLVPWKSVFVMPQ